MRRLAFTGFFLFSFAAPAEALVLNVDITYTGGQIVSGPLSPDLPGGALPASVLASFVLNVSAVPPFDTVVGRSDVLAASLVFGDAAWNLSNLQVFDTAITTGGSLGEFFITSLSYSYGKVDTASAKERLAQNFPLEIQGTVTATGEPFHYMYANSSESVNVVPEPSTAVLVAAGLAALAVQYRRLGGAATRDRSV